jgi:S1/P1 Nuclease/Metal binding domain of Ada
MCRMRSATHFIANLVFALMLFPVSAWGWGDDGHKIVAVIATDNLTPAAASHVANVLGVAGDKRVIANAMEAASIRPDWQFRSEYPLTKPWHFIDICLQDRRADIPARCPSGNCVTAKIDEYSKRLKDGNYDHFGAADDLAFLIHFVGDIHQPLHAATDADGGGNCVKVDSHYGEQKLHAIWDTAVVHRLEDSIDSGKPVATAHRLEEKYAAEKETDSWIAADDIAWESNQIARSDIYSALHIPIEPCQPDLCRDPLGHPVELDSSYLDHADAVAGHQLAKAGFRLASLLNEIWTQPAGPNDATHATNGDSAPAENPPAETVASQIVFVGNRRSKIYAWPGCGSYDRMAPANRVVFQSREAAEQDGYRAARNCP